MHEQSPALIGNAETVAYFSRIPIVQNKDAPNYRCLSRKTNWSSGLPSKVSPDHLL